MLAAQGYYDGVTIKPLEKIVAKPNQRVIITIMDEFVERSRLLIKRECVASLQSTLTQN